MKKICLLINTLLILSCSNLPIIHQMSSDIYISKNNVCPSPFIKNKFQLVYAIEIQIKNQFQGSIIGATLIDPSVESVSCVIMTPEGMVIFEAETRPNLFKVNRALPPFDSTEFSKKIIEDIKMVFLAPAAELQQKGFLTNGLFVCRYLKENGDLIDIIKNESKGTEVNYYSSHGYLKRHIELSKIVMNNVHESISLQGKVSEIMDYTLIMTLIDAKRIDKLSEKKLKTKK